MDSRLTSSQSSGVFRSLSDSPPVHCTVNLDSFSLLTKFMGHSEGQDAAYESDVFKAGGYQWKLVIYPKGNKTKMVEDHVSVYLQIAGVNQFETGWEVYVDFRLFLLDQNKNLYIVFEDAFTQRSCIHSSNLGVGFDRLVPLDEFHDQSRGYLVDNKCVFGAEVFVCKEIRKGMKECVSNLLCTPTYKHLWLVDDLLKDPVCISDSFSVGGHEWHIKLNCNKDDEHKMMFIFVLKLLDDQKTSPCVTKVFAELSSCVVHSDNDQRWNERGPVACCFNNGGKSFSWEVDITDYGWTAGGIRFNYYSLRIETKLRFYGITERLCGSEEQSKSIKTRKSSAIQKRLEPYFKETLCCLAAVSIAVGFLFLRKYKTS